MSPVAHPLTAGGSTGYRIRHVGPKAVIWPNPPAKVATVAVLNQPEMIARMLPASSVPSAVDYQQGQWTARVGDAGDGQVVFPNSVASDGVPWRDRFHSDGHLEFLELYNDGYLEMVFCIVNPQRAMQTITVAGQDGMFLLKKAFERDWIVTQAPRDVIERGTQVWVAVLSDDFSYDGVTDPLAQWSTAATTSPATVQIAATGGCVLFALNGPFPPVAEIDSAVLPVAPTAVWQASIGISFSAFSVVHGRPAGTPINITLTESSGDTVHVGLATYTSGGPASVTVTFTGTGGSATYTAVSVPPAPAYAVWAESDGDFISVYVNGQLIGAARRFHATTSSFMLSISAGNAEAVLSSVMLRAQQPFLMRGADKGDYALPDTMGYAVGTVASYPPVGLHARYFDDSDLAADAGRLWKIQQPNRTVVFGGAGGREYANQQDAQVNAQANAAGAAATNWSVVWFGAIYLKLNRGDYTMRIDTPAVNTAVRVWVGETTLGSEQVNLWSFANHGNVSFVVSGEQLAGTLPYGGGLVFRDGWYPIKIEYAVDGVAGAAPVLRFTSVPGVGPSSTSYTDPGGTVISFGPQTTVVPSTSLSPLGLVDNRFQGIAHFDLVQQTLNGFGYQASVEPQRLESGLFPGVLAPRWREGHDTDVILEPDIDPRKDLMLNYTSQEDATDLVTSIQGNGAGFSGGGTLQAMVFDHTSLEDALFDAQGWQDFSDSSYISLLQAQLNALLGLRLTPWELVSADPRAVPRLSYLWPLPAGVAQMRWRPGDGVRLRARDIGVWDLTPRQMLTVQRQFVPLGVTGTSVGWADRPRGALLTLRQLFYTITRLQRTG